MPEYLARCPICSNIGSDILDRRMFADVEVVNLVCRKCGVVYMSPRMSDEENEAFYSTQYRKMYQGQEGPTDENLRTQIDRASNLTAFAARSVDRVGSALEIGASSGALLRALAGRYGCQTVGVELGDAYRSFAESNGTRMVRRLEEIKGEQFDLVCMSHVLEHIADPVQFLSILKDHFLTVPGRLLIEVPNVFGHDSFEPAHLFSFSATTLKQILWRAGFTVEKLHCHGHPKSSFRPLYLTALASPTEAPFRFKAEHGIAKKRKFGLFYSRAAGRVISLLGRQFGRPNAALTSEH